MCAASCLHHGERGDHASWGVIMAVGKDATLYASNGTFKLKSSDFPLMANPVSKEDRLVASDWLEERGHDAVADDLRHLTCNATKEQLIAVIELEEFKTWPARQCVVLRLCTIKIAETKEHAQLAVEGLSVAFDQAGEAVSAAAVDGFSALPERNSVLT